VIQPLLPNKPRGCRGSTIGVCSVAIFRGCARARRGPTSRTLWADDDLVTASTGGGAPACGIGILEAVSKAYDGGVQMISSSIRVHQHAANTQKKRSIPLLGSLGRRADD
jgi:hypothetical protein